MDFTKEQYKKALDSMCEMETEARQIAREVLSEHDVYGDSYGVPTIADVVESLVFKVKAKDPSKSRCDCCGCLLEGQCGGQL